MHCIEALHEAAKLFGRVVGKTLSQDGGILHISSTHNKLGP